MQWRCSNAVYKPHHLKLISRLFIFLLPMLAGCAVSCSGHGHSEALDRAESLMEAHPDSAMTVLDGIERPDLGSGAERARYALLMSMALDKNYIDTTTFDVLQPAIDYYLENGTPDEKLRTYYYQGRIFQNQGDQDKALSTFLKATDNATGSTDSLTMARALVAQGGLYKAFYNLDSYKQCYLRAAKIYKGQSRGWHEFDCLLNAWNGAILLKDKALGDSIMAICEDFKDLDEDQTRRLAGYRLSHALEFADTEELKELIANQRDYAGLDANGLLNLANANNRIGDAVKAKQLLDSVSGKPQYNRLKYLATSVLVFEKLENYKEAYATYKDFSSINDSINLLKFEQKTQYINEKHQIELRAKNDSIHKTRIIWGCIAGILALAMGMFILFLLVRSNKTQKDLALQRAKASEFENEKLKTENEKRALEYNNIQLERDKKALEAENLGHRVETLENESESLKSLLEAREYLPSEVREEIQVRIEMLNSLLAGYITANQQYERPYETWIKELTDNKDAFMNSNRLAFQASHPRFIRYFEEHNLTVDEINYVCLYAIGLRGKEVGIYMKKRSHVNTSSAIRKKLGIDVHETNLGIYVRKLLKTL